MDGRRILRRRREQAFQRLIGKMATLFKYFFQHKEGSITSQWIVTDEGSLLLGSGQLRLALGVGSAVQLAIGDRELRVQAVQT